jgi:uncharacterized membrane protein
MKRLCVLLIVIFISWMFFVISNNEEAVLQRLETERQITKQIHDFLN